MLLIIGSENNVANIHFCIEEFEVAVFLFLKKYRINVNTIHSCVKF